jgi:hypothetical protein
MQPPLYFTSGTAATQAISGATEVVVATLNGVVTPYGANQTVVLRGRAFITSPGSTTGVVLRIRRASLTGTLVSDQTGQTVITAAADSNIYEVGASDTPGDVTGFTYVLTVVCTAGSGAGSSIYASLDAFVQ